MGSRLFDGETLPVSQRYMIEKGVLNGWLLTLSTAAQLGMTPDRQCVTLAIRPALAFCFQLHNGKWRDRAGRYDS